MNSHFRLKNPNLNEEDIFYHLKLSTTQDLSLYEDVMLVCMGGTPSRMLKFAQQMYKKLDCPRKSVIDSETNELIDIAKGAGRYSMYKVGPVLSVSHGVGMDSLSVVLNELFKLLHHAKASKDVVFIRMGTSGGLGVVPGTLVITEQPYSSTLKKEFAHVAFGEKMFLPSVTCPKTRKELEQCARKLKFPVVIGNTMSTNDFYEGQCRLDGAFCDYDMSMKMNFLRQAHDEYGIRNIEMESLCLSALCNRAGLRCAVVCAAIVNRLEGDAIKASELNEWEQRLFELVGDYILNQNI